eukprot:gene22488-28616_t
MAPLMVKGSCEDAFELLSVLTNDHRNLEGEDDPLDVNELLNNNKQCSEEFNKWLQKQTSDHISKTTAQFKVTKAARALEVDNRPTRWEDVVMKCVPLQEGEEGDVELSVEPDEVPPIPDPLGISDADLRITQELYSSGRLFKTQNGGYSRRGTAFVGNSPLKGGIGRSSDDRDDDSDSSDSDGGGGEDGQGGGGGGRLESFDQSATGAIGTSSNTGGEGFRTGGGGANRNQKQSLSIIPSDKSFSTTLFLSLVHGSISFDRLREGERNLKELLQQQSSRRENLVRLHFGLFVQCADGLEWLKAFRKGVYKLSEMPKIKTYRKSTVELSKEAKMNAAASRGSSADKGMEKLKKAQTTLDLAKLEAQSTLAPILERMKQSRRVKNAEKVLRRMSAILEHPQKMRMALDRGDLQEVVLIYQRVQAIPTTISLRILQRVKTAADSLVAEMKRQLLVSLLTPSTNHHMLLRYCKILLDLDGPQAYLDVLRQCIIRQILHFVELIKETKDRFCTDAADAFSKAQELSMMNKSNFYSTSDREAIAAALRKYTHLSTHNVAPKRASTVKSSPRGPLGRKGLTSAGSFYVPTEDPDDMSVAGGLHVKVDEFDADQGDGGDDDVSEADWLDYEDSVFGDDSPGPGGASGLWERGSIAGDSVLGGLGRNQQREVDNCALLSSHVRQHYLESVVDTIAKWFPCLLRLVSEYLVVQAAHHKKATATITAATPFLNAGMKSSNMSRKGGPSAAPAGTNNFFNQRTSQRPPVIKLLGSALKLYSEFIRQTVHGISVSFQSFPLPAELVTAFSELDVNSSFNNSAGGSGVTSAVSALASLQALITPSASLTSPVDAKTFETLISASVFTEGLKEPFRRTILREIYDLYDGIEGSLNSDMVRGAHNPKAASNTFGLATSNAPFAKQHVPFSGGSQSSTASSSENYFLVVTSPYYESVNMLQVLSREGEIQVAQKIMDRLTDLGFKLCDFTASHSAVSLMTNMGASGHGGGDESSKRVTGGGSSRVDLSSGGVASSGKKISRKLLKLEQTVHELESLITRCLHKVTVLIKRTDWVAQVVHDGVLKVLTSFVEALRREEMLIEDSKSGLLRTQSQHGDSSNAFGVPSPTGKRGGKKPTGGTRASISNGLVIQSLEEELRNSETLDKQKVAFLLDLLRACIRLRNYSTPLLHRLLTKMFPISVAAQSVAFDSVLGATATSSSAPSASDASSPAEKSTSMLNKLFAFESVAPEPTSRMNKKGSFYGAPAIRGGSPVTISPNKNGSELKASSQSVSLLDRLQGSLDEDSGALMSVLNETATLESKVVVSYLEQKRREIHGAVHAGYHLLARRETAGSWMPVVRLNATESDGTYVPTHLSRILLMIGHEKSSLAAELGRLTVECGGKKQASASGPVKSRRSSPTKASRPSSVEEDALSDEDSDEDYDDSLQDEHEEQTVSGTYSNSFVDGRALASSTGQSAMGLKYCEHIYAELCVALVDMYAELIAKLKGNTFLSGGTAAGPCSTPHTLGQACEEMEYLKTVFKSLLLSSSSSSNALSSAPSRPNLNAPVVAASPSGGEYFATSQQLVRDAKLLSMLVAN